MKLLVIFSILMFGFIAEAGLSEAVNDCYQRSQTLEQASKCADLRLARAIERTLPPVPPEQTHSIIYQCTDEFNPQLYKTIYDRTGKRVRNTAIKSYVSGTSGMKNRLCREDAFQSNYVFSDGIKTECSCSNDFNPVLKLMLLDENYSQLVLARVGTFSEGVMSKKMDDCNQAINRLQACHIQ